ncbi:hypothetical protein T07_8043 [Trichinella nelsoni]|uniref:Uncharacterized protein n=1 Tax=Trichinella nelsoni TaxID=6336 RepID=A0A0V0RWV7_9BILA|nr:hypothetical protein T07_8043 [Trichinella nelsoni]
MQKKDEKIRTATVNRTPLNTNRGIYHYWPFYDWSVIL